MWPERSARSVTCVCCGGHARYDFNKPEEIPSKLHHTFTMVVIDPPFITREVRRAWPPWPWASQPSVVLRRCEGAGAGLHRIESPWHTRHCPRNPFLTLDYASAHAVLCYAGVDVAGVGEIRRSRQPAAREARVGC